MVVMWIYVASYISSGQFCFWMELIFNTVFSITSALTKVDFKTSLFENTEFIVAQAGINADVCHKKQESFFKNTPTSFCLKSQLEWGWLF